MARRRAEGIEIPGLDVPRAKRYSRTRLAVLLGSTAWSTARLIWFVSDGRAARLKAAVAETAPDQRLVAPAFLALWAAFSWLSGLPVAFLGGYAVERRYGLTKQPMRSWFGDQVKGIVLAMAIQVPLVSAAYAVMRRRPRDWWLILPGAAVPLAVVFSNLAPTLLMPVFNAFVPLRDAALGERIRTMSQRAGVEISDVYEMDMSRQSEKPNALFIGLGNSKRIVLGDTLLERFEADEIEAVVAHELGHQVHGDIWRLIGFAAGAGFGAAWLLSRTAPPALRGSVARTGVQDVSDVASAPILALLLTGMGIILMPIQAAFSRAMERRADRYAIELTGDGAAYARAMERLASLALADPDPPRPVVFFLYSHPPIADRIQSARQSGVRPEQKADQR